jgi:adenylylsulfate reductase subunit B
MPPIIDADICTGCGVCVDHCPQDVFFGSQSKETPIVSFAEECWHCFACVLDCPASGAITIRTPIPMLLCYR